MPEIQTVETAIENAATEAANLAPEIKTMADVGLDAASLAAANIEKTANASEPDVAAQKIVTLESKVAELETVIESIPALIASIKSHNETAFNAALETAIAKLPDASQIESRVNEIEAAIPDMVAAKDAVEKVIADIEAELPSGWKSRVTALLAVAKQHFGI